MPRTLKETRAAKSSTRKGGGKPAAKKPAKPASRQRKAAKAPAAASTPAAPPKAAESPAAQAFADWQAGKPINELSTKYGIKRSKLRRLLIGLAGGKDQFKSLRGTGAGGTVEPFGGKRATGGRIVGSIGSTIDDSKVPRISSTRASDGWTVRRVWAPTLVSVEIERQSHKVPARELVATVHVAPDGDEYVEAKSNEPADLIYDCSSMNSVVRMRRYEESRIAKKIAKSERQEEAQVERGEIALERTRERKRKAKESRKRA